MLVIIQRIHQQHSFQALTNHAFYYQSGIWHPFAGYTQKPIQLSILIQPLRKFMPCQPAFPLFIIRQQHTIPCLESQSVIDVVTRGNFILKIVSITAVLWDSHCCCDKLSTTSIDIVNKEYKGYPEEISSFKTMNHIAFVCYESLLTWLHLLFPAITWSCQSDLVSILV